MTAFTVLAQLDDGNLDCLLVTNDGEQANLTFRDLLKTNGATSDGKQCLEVWLLNTRVHLRHRKIRRPEVKVDLEAQAKALAKTKAKASPAKPAKRAKAKASEDGT